MKLVATVCIAACAALWSSGAVASGDGGPYDRFAARGEPDFSLAQFQAGQLGILQTGYQRAYLYIAWRAIALGVDGLAAAPNPAGGVLRATGRNYSGWDRYEGSKEIRDGWKAAAARALHQTMDAQAPQAWSECPREGYVFATQTLASLAQRADATPSRLQAWIEAQDRVFTFCGDDSRPHAAFTRLPPLPVPEDLPATEGVWAQLRGYQVAAALFYKGDLAESARRFSAIGASAGHPMRQWGAYLALRAAMRESGRDLKAGHPDLTERAAELSAEAQHILADPSLAALHEPTRAAVRAMLTRLTPAARFAQLNDALADPRANPYLDDYLGDWRILANDELDRFNPERGARQARNHDFIDWIVTLQSCGFLRNNCGAQRDHARARWEALDAAGDRAGSRTWLVAALMMAQSLPPSMERAALAVGPAAPEYATVRYNLARTYRLAGQGGKARATADAMLAMPAVSAGVRNLFLQERFAQATSIADAARFLLRQPIREIDPDTSESRAPDERRVPASDGLRWLNTGLTVADLLELARNPALGAPLRNAIAAMAWLRADLLGEQDAALAAAALLAPATPEFGAAARAYRGAPTAQARRHALVLAALRLHMTTALEAYEPHLTEPFAAIRPSETVASNWCKGASGQGAFGPLDDDPEHPPPLPATAADPGRLAREIAALEALPTATGFLGRHVMEHAALAPADPDLAWLLYVVVQSTRGGCLDPDVHAMSRNAFILLHERFPDSEWARKTPFYY